jgi:hypothetical protein
MDAYEAGFSFTGDGKRPGPDEFELSAGYNEFSYDLETHQIHVIGYTPGEVHDLLHLYREHLQLLADFTRQQTDLMDAYRSGPGDIPPGP